MSFEMWDEDDDDSPYEYIDEEQTDLGTCCACGKEDETVRNIGMLDFVAPVPGTGWGCVVCDIPNDGALVVVCDECMEAEKPYKWLIRGMPAGKGRIALEGFVQVPYGHDLSRHPEVKPFKNAHGVMTSNFDVVEGEPFFRMPTKYVPPLNTPLYWRDEVSGVLPAAMMAYIGHSVDPEMKAAPTTEQLTLIIGYCRYFINAPCWRDETGLLTRLRAQAASLTTMDDLKWWIVDCLAIGLDPL